MSDDSKTISLMFLKEQVLRWAALKRHSHKAEDIEDMDSKYAPVNHADASNKYGLGDTDKYGHVKVDDEISDSSVNPVQNKVIKQAITDAINNLRNELINKLQEKFNIVTEITSESTDKTDNKYNIPTAHAVWSALTNYKELFVGRSWDSPKKIDENIDNMRTPGYFLQTSNRHFFYGGESSLHGVLKRTVEPAFRRQRGDGVGRAVFIVVDVLRAQQRAPEPGQQHGGSTAEHGRVAQVPGAFAFVGVFHVRFLLSLKICKNFF